MPETNKALVRQMFEEGMNKNDEAIFDALIARSYVNHDMPAPAPGPEGFKQVLGQFRAAFPDMHVTLQDEVAEGDKVVTRGVFRGTHRGEFMGVPPTSKQVEVKYIDIWRVENGKLTENWVQLDLLGLLQQLGAIPAPAGS